MDNQYNVLIDFVSVLLVGAIMLAGRGQKRRGDRQNAKLLNSLLICCILVFLTDVPGLLLDGCEFSGARELLWFFDSAYWMLQVIYCWLWLVFADYWAFGSKEHMRKNGFIFALPMLIELALVAINPITGWIFTIDSMNVYARGEYYLLNMLPYAVYIVGALAVTINGYRKSTDPEQKRRKLSLVVYMFLPICGVFFDAFIYGISWVWPMVALSLLMVYLHVQQQLISEEQLDAARMEAELTESRVAIMLSQIQPHFLYNALNTIKHFCAGNPKAQEIVTDFAKYLRGNMDSLSDRAPIPFERELEHLRHYLNIETLRFPDVKVEYDLGASAFMLPALSVQPLVENAICHGVTQRADGGTVKISSREDEQEFTVCIEDNGVGFNAGAEQDDGRSHIGISNVRLRLAAMCGGALEVESMAGVGTKATIHIPKEAAQ